MPTDLTGTPTPLGIGTYNVNVDAPSGLGFNAAMAQIDTLIGLRAALNSPTFTGSPKAPTKSPGDNSTNIATTAYVDAAIAALSINNAVYTNAIVTSSSGASVTPDLTNGPYQIYSFNSSYLGPGPCTLTINAPTNVPNSTHTQRLTIVVKYVAAGLNGLNITWNGAFHEGSVGLPGSAPGTTGHSVACDFVWDGLIWVLLSKNTDFSGGNG